MNLNDLHEKLINAARRTPPGDQVPYAFEKRVMHHIRALPAPTPWALWSGPLWRAAVSCLALTAACSLWALVSSRPPEPQESFSQAFEAAVFNPPGQSAEDAW